MFVIKFNKDICLEFPHFLRFPLRETKKQANLRGGRLRDYRSIPLAYHRSSTETFNSRLGFLPSPMENNGTLSVLAKANTETGPISDL